MRINIDELTLGQIKQIKTILSDEEKSRNPQIGSDMVGRYVLARSRNEGVNAGYVVQMDETGIVLREARRIWYHKPKNKALSWYEGVAVSGLSDDSKISCSTYKIIMEDYSITVCSRIAEESILKKDPNEQN